MNCPKCQTPLVPHSADGLELDSCPDCHGTWFQENELEKAKNLADENVRWMDFEIWKHSERFTAKRGLACPHCGDAQHPMATLTYGTTKVEIDYCLKCRGVWLEDHALERIVKSLETELENKPTRELFTATLKEALEVATAHDRRASEWKDFRQLLRLLALRLTVENPGLHGMITGALRGTPFS